MTAPIPSVADGTSIDDWISVGIDGRVTVRSGKVEIGTGLRTALAQIAAEELDVAVGDIDLVAGLTGVTPDEGYTAGSTSVAIGGARLRQVAAEARAVLIELARTRLEVPKGEHVDVSGGVVRWAGAKTSFAELLGGRSFGRPVTGTAPLKNPADYHIVGRPVPRIDVPRKVLGGENFVSDVRLPGMLHARVVRPKWFGCPVLEVDDVELPAGSQVVRKGDFVAVVAESEAVAVHAASVLRVRWGPGDPAPAQEDLYEWMLDCETVHQPLAVPPPRREPVPVDGAQVHRHAAEYRWPFQAHSSIGPATAVADVRPDGVTVYAAAQGVYQLQSGLAVLLDLPPESIQVVHREGPGCYGHNGADDAAADAAVISQLLGKPVRVQWSRQDEFVWARKGPATVARVQAHLDDSGRICDWESDLWTSTHGGRAFVPERFVAGQLLARVSGPNDSVFVGGDRNGPVNYDLPRQKVTMHWLPRPAIPGSSLRALGSTANSFANESFMDELAAEAGVDPLEFRLRHLDDQRGRDVLMAAAEHAGWGTPMAEGHGRGIAYAQYENNLARLATVAEVVVDPLLGLLRVERIVVAHDCGLVVNPDGLRNQIEGNVVQSLSRTLLEEVRWADGELLSVDWESYPILRFPDLPTIDVVIVDRPFEPATGAGEPATILTAPAIANAVHDAVGVRLRTVPFTSKRLRHALADIKTTQ